MFWSFHLAPLKQPIRIRSSPKTHLWRLAPNYRRPTIPLTSFQSLLCSWIVFSSVWYQQYSGAVLPPSVMVLFLFRSVLFNIFEAKFERIVCCSVQLGEKSWGRIEHLVLGQPKRGKVLVQRWGGWVHPGRRRWVHPASGGWPSGCSQAARGCLLTPRQALTLPPPSSVFPLPVYLQSTAASPDQGGLT